MLRELTAHPDGPVLLCFPPAGVGPSIFRAWPAALERTLHVVAVSLPGRPGDTAEEPVRSAEAFTATLSEAAASYAGRPLALFGHSAGCYLALCAASELARHRSRVDVVLAAPPSSPEALTVWSEAPDDELLARLIRLGQVERTVATVPALSAEVLRPLRADLALARACAARFTERSRFPGRLVVDAHHGRDDPLVEPTAPAPRSVIGAPVRSSLTFPGSHFFPFEPGSRFPRYLERRLAARPAAPSGEVGRGPVEPE